MKRCKYCRSLLNDSVLICPGCGSHEFFIPIPEPEVTEVIRPECEKISPESATDNEKNRFWAITICLSLVLCLLISCGLLPGFYYDAVGLVDDDIVSIISYSGILTGLIICFLYNRSVVKKTPCLLGAGNYICSVLLSTLATIIPGIIAGLLCISLVLSVIAIGDAFSNS